MNTIFFSFFAKNQLFHTITKWIITDLFAFFYPIFILFFKDNINIIEQANKLTLNIVVYAEGDTVMSGANTEIFILKILTNNAVMPTDRIP